MASEEEMMKTLVQYAKEHGAHIEEADATGVIPNKWSVRDEGSHLTVTQDADKKSMSVNLRNGVATVDYFVGETSPIFMDPGEVYYHNSNASRLKETYDKWIVN